MEFSGGALRSNNAQNHHCNGLDPHSHPVHNGTPSRSQESVQPPTPAGFGDVCCSKAASVRSCQKFFGGALRRDKASQHLPRFPMFPNLCQPFPTFPNVSQPLPTFPNVFQPLHLCQPLPMLPNVSLHTSVNTQLGTSCDTASCAKIACWLQLCVIWCEACTPGDTLL